mmetsp:Transcript_18617/g.31842  ORF Transcript_18617/g.31842 Transcript_18617/m.31842 type:complete len:90 (-) Transcript_18617:4-273(-)
MIKRLRYPKWFIEMAGHTPDPDDYSDGRLDEQRTLRENQLNLLGRLCSFKPIQPPLLNFIAQLFDQTDPNTAEMAAMEIPLQLMTTLAQ